MAMIEINRDPSRRQLNQFGVIWLLFFTLLTALSWLELGSPSVAAALAGAALGVPLLGSAVPAFMRLVYVGMSTLAWPIGFVVSHVVLLLVWALVVTPIGLLLRLAGYDPMARRFDPDAETYWHRRPPDPTDPRRPFRQF